MALSTLHRRIQSFYDESTPLWLEVWGEHMHHGYYGEQGSTAKSHAQAQLDLVNELLRWGGVEAPTQILDAGCGVGGSARILAKRFGAKVLGCTLSPVQAQRGNQYSQEAGLGQLVDIQAVNVFDLEGEGRFDLIWSLESAEHMAPKDELIQLFYRLLKPGGTLLMATWCHRSTPPELQPEESRLLEKISQLYHLPPWVPMQTYVKYAKEAGFEQIQTADWTQAVSPFWKAVIRSVFQWRSITGLLKAGWSTIQGAWAMQYMTAGFRKGIIKFEVFQAQKP